MTSSKTLKPSSTSKTLPSKVDLKNFTAQERALLKEQVAHALCLRGKLRHLCRPGGQARLYEAVRAHQGRFKGVPEPFIMLCHRRLGKTFLLTLLCLERALSQPGATVFFGSSTTKQAQGLFEPQLGILMRSMPRGIKHRSRHGVHYLTNPRWKRDIESKIIPAGLDYRSGDPYRGYRADLVALDEVRDCASLKYAFEDVFKPMFVRTENPLVLMATTPPRSLDHDFITHFIHHNKAFERGTMLVIPASGNPDWTVEDERVVVSEGMPKDSPTYRREIECDLVSDLEGLVIPEFLTNREQIVKPDVDRPRHYTAYVSFDAGFSDHTGVLFAYLDFLRQKVRIVGEFFVRRAATDDLVAGIRERLFDLFPNGVRDGAKLIADATPQQIEDIRRRYGMHFLSVQKYDKDAARAQCRALLQQGRVEIVPSCEKLIYQLENGVWNERGKDYQRTKAMGHLDLIDSLIYLMRSIHWNKNPFPNNPEVDLENVVYRDGPPKPKPGVGRVKGTKAVVRKLFRATRN